ncbi:hypothetical protein [Anaerosporobacter sp.]|nr:hypothetical protein [Anaerosporobacter sp.]
MEIYEGMMRQMNIYRELEVSENQIVEGKTKDAETSLAAMKNKHNIP